MDDAYDIVIVGAGPAGASAARAAAEKGVAVLLVDRRQRIGIPVQCAEFVPQGISRHVTFSSKCILQTVETMVTHLPDKTFHEMRSPGYMVDRSLFDKDLATSAILAGANLSMGWRASGLSPEGLVLEQATRTRIVRPRVIIGSDGVHSAVARWMGQPPAKTIVALQYEVVNRRPQDYVDIFFRKDFEGGYAWFFPKGRTANIGVGAARREAFRLPALLKGFVNDLIDSKKIREFDVVGRTGGSIPCGRPRQTVYGNTLLVGDAAGHAHPITGAGILHAVIGGEIAGKTAAEAVVKGDLQSLARYEAEWQEAFAKPLLYGASKRELLEENWNRPGVDFEGLIRKTWVGFKEYYEERAKDKG